MPEPWASIVNGLTGPYGVIIAMGLAIYFLWKLFREEQQEVRKTREAMTVLVDAVEDMTREVKAWREATR